MWRQRAVRGLAATLLLALLTGAHANHIQGHVTPHAHGHASPSGRGRTWPCSHAAAQSSPEVLQLLRKTGNAFKQVGDILLKKTGAPCAPTASALTARAPRPQPVPVPRYAYGYPHPYFYYPMPVPSGQPPVYPMHYVPGPYSVQAQAVAQPQQDGPMYPAELSNQLVSLASEYEQAAQNECSCGNVEVNMRQGPSSLAAGKASDIVVEVTLGDLTQAEEQQEQEAEAHQEQQQTKKTVNILNISEASEGGEFEAETSAKASSSASVEEKTIEETDETHTIQVVEAIKLQPETSPLQVETFDNTAAAVEKTIKETVVLKSETEETKTIVSDNGETVINVKTYEESFPKTPVQQEEEMYLGGEEEDVVEEEAYAPDQPQHQNAYDEKVEVVEVQEETLEELKKEASVVSEIVETVDIEEKETDVTKAVVTETKTVTQTETASRPQEDVKIVVVDVEAGAKKNDTATQTATGDAQYFEYDYEYVDVTPDCVDNDAKDLQKYFPSSPSPSKSAVPKYASQAEEKKEGLLQEGEHLLLERPRPVENVQVVVKGTSAQAYAEGLQVHSAAAAAAQQQQQQAHSTLHHHHHAAQAPQPAYQTRPKPAVVFDVPCEAHYGIPKPGHRQRQNALAHSHHHVKSYQTNDYPAPTSQPQPQPQGRPWWPQPEPVQPTPPCKPEPVQPQPQPQPWWPQPKPVQPTPPCEPAPQPQPQPWWPQPKPVQPTPPYEPEPVPTGFSEGKPAPAVYYSRSAQKQAPQQPAAQYIAGPRVYYEQPTPKPVPQKPEPVPQYIPGPTVFYEEPTPKPAPQQPEPVPQYIPGPPVFYEEPTPEPAPQQPEPVPQYIPGPHVYYEEPTPKPAPQQPSPKYIPGPPVYYVRPTPTPKPAPQQPTQQYFAGPPVYYERPRPQPAPQQPPHQYVAGPPVYQTRPAPKPEYLPGPAVYYAPQQKTVQTKKTTVTEYQSSAARPAYGAPVQQSLSSYYQPAPQASSAFTSYSQTSRVQPGQGLHHRQQVKAGAQEAASRIILGAVQSAAAAKQQQSSKTTPAQYPPYYFTAHADSIYAPPIIKRRPVAKPAPAVSLAFASAPASASVSDSAEVVPQRYASEISYKPAAVAVSVPAAAQAFSTVVEDSAEEQQHAAVAPAVVKVALPVQKKPFVPAQSFAVPVEEDVFEEVEEEPSAPAELVQLPSVKVEKQPVSVVVGASKGVAAAGQSEEDLFDDASNAWTNGQSDAGEVVVAEKLE